jgi:M6 family metalloprotease-like protein
MTFQRSIYAQILCFAVIFTTAPTLAVDLDAERMIDSLAKLEFDQLGSPQIKTDSIKPVLAGVERPHRLLVIAVEFPELGYDRFPGDKKQNNKNRDYLQRLLFGGSVKRPKAGTLSHYYRHQSKGLYNVTGKVMPIAKVSKPLAHYGRPLQNADGSWRNDDHTDELVVEALQAAHRDNPKFPWKDYDIWDPEDFDGDGNRAEADGYLDHLVIVYAGKAQSSCQGLYKLNEKFTVNAESDVFDSLPAAEQDCADRIWPHRSSLNRGLGKGPVLEGMVNGRGGYEIEEGLWLYDYNMQSEYTEVSTFIHEFGHSLGLPDIYARATNNSSASWEAMSATASPEPQELSAWSRMVLGWLNPCIVRPPAFGGDKRSSMYLKTMNDWSNKAGTENSRGVCDATMIILPPKIRELQLGPLGKDQGKYAVYTGQGNDLHHFLSRSFDLRQVNAEQQLILSFDTWFKIESDWDYLYIEASIDGDSDGYQRLLPTDKVNAADTNSTMPSKKGHEGDGSLPGFSGRSGDMDGDGKVEIAIGCDPSASKVLAEDRVGENIEDACETAQWIAAEFDLEAYRGKQISIRLHYFADGAAVEDGALIDNIRLDALGYNEDFESGAIKGWSSDGFTLSGGEHRIAVPHYYLLEYRDPYASFDSVKNYDAGLAKPGFSFFKDSDGDMKAFSANYRPGVLVWYYNGEYLWSQNEPAQFGPGNGFLLLVDANPQEFNLPNVPEQYFVDDQGWTSYQFDESAQPWLEQSYVDVMCHQRRSAFYSSDVSVPDRKRCYESLVDGLPAVESLKWEGRKLMYGYTLINRLLPGADRLKYKGVSSLFDLRIRGGKTEYRLYDRALRNRHSGDAPFALESFAKGSSVYSIDGDRLVEQSSKAYPPVSEFSDARPNRYQNPKLPFGGANIPEVGLRFKLGQPSAEAPDEARVKVVIDWD